MKSMQTNLSRLKACRKLAGGKAASSRRSAAKAEGRRPGYASHRATALKERENGVLAIEASWSAPAERSGDGAFARTGREQINEIPRPRESGVALRFPPQSKTSRNLSQLRRSEIFVENRPAQDSPLRRSGIFRGPGYAAPTELNDLL